MQTIRGKLVRKDGKLIFQTRFSPKASDIDVPLEEIFEDFENLGVEVTVSRRNIGDPIWTGLVPDWESLPETTVDPDYKFCSEAGREKFLDMKLGLMVHFGLYSHLGTLESWAAYAKSAPQWFFDIYYTLWQVWNPVQFNAEQWARLVKRAGLQFIQITSKHCEGFALWDTKAKVRARRRIGSKSGTAVEPVEDAMINYSVMDTSFKRDIIKELSDAFRKHGLGFSIYYSHWDWEDPNFRWDEGNRCYDPAYNPKDNPQEWAAMIDRERTHLRELFSNYGPIDQVFFDTTWFGLAWKEFKRMIKEWRKLQPNCMFSDRGLGPYGDFTSPERWYPTGPGTTDPRVHGRVWEVCETLTNHWSYNPDDTYKDFSFLMQKIIDVIAKGGTMTLDAGPMPNGYFEPKTVELLERIGRWLQVNGQAIYATRFRDPFKEGEKIFFTQSKDHTFIYLIHIGWPYQKVEVASVKPKPKSKIFMLGVKDPLPWTYDGKALTIEIPASLNNQIPCEYAFCFKIEQ